MSNLIKQRNYKDSLGEVNDNEFIFKKINMPNVLFKKTSKNTKVAN